MPRSALHRAPRQRPFDHSSLLATGFVQLFALTLFQTPWMTDDAASFPDSTMKPVSSWGRLESPLHRVETLHDPAAAARQMQAAPLPGLAFGRGRSYGDVCLNPGGTLWMTTGLDRLIDFDASTGRLRCEAGVLLHDLQRWGLTRGWMLPVTPGTQWVSVGGAIANDVHGKNHHRQGSFGDHVCGLRLARTDGAIIECGPDHQADWFAATVGGLGLTGVILEATLQLRPVAGPWLSAETLPFRGLDAFFDLADASAEGWEYTVSWIDCLSGKTVDGIFLRARHAQEGPARMPASRRLRMPFDPPVSLVNPLTLRMFNFLYRAMQTRRAGIATVHYQPFFYPLDGVQDWNRMYGRQGFYQHQCVLPEPQGRAAIAEVLQTIAQAGEGSFLAVLKTFGDRPAPGLLSFPRAGVTLALDFPNRGARTLQLLDRLDAIVGAASGRIYPAKDARMSRALFEQGYPRLADFLPFRDPGIRSGLSRRLLGD